MHGAIKMDRAPKKRKPLILIGIVCDDEMKDFIDFKSAKEKSKMVEILIFHNSVLIFNRK